MILLGIETSCDETAVAVLRDGEEILADLLSSQSDLHQKYGGVVPELACRRHIETIGPLVREALVKSDVAANRLGGVAVTAGPGLVGALLVGVSFAKSLAYALKVPLLAVSHLEGHIASAFLEHSDIVFPCVALVVSGGHTNLYYMPGPGEYRLLGRTRDDAAGEALDKGARILGYGYPGGPVIDRLARQGDPLKFSFPRPCRSVSHYDFSFSGLKTSLARTLSRIGPASENLSSLHPDIAAGYQSAVVESLVEKTSAAIQKERARSALVVGGVAANSLLRRRIQEEGERLGVATYIPSPRYCTDNGAMIALAGLWRHQGGRYASLDLNPRPNLELPYNLDDGF